MLRQAWLGFLLITSPAWSQPEAPPASAPSGPDAGEERVLRPEGRVMELSLEECLMLARRDNLSLRAAALNQPQAEAGRMAASGFFDPAFFLNPRYQERERPGSSTFDIASRSKTYGFNAGFQGRVMTGATWLLSYDHSYNRFEAPSFSGGVLSRDAFTNWTGLATLSLTQPLLRGAWLRRNESDITRAEIAAEAAGDDYADLGEATLLEVTRAYWNLVYAREIYRVRRLSLEVARRQLEITEQRIKAALAAEVERVANQADIAGRRLDLIGAENQVLAAEDTLKAQLFPFRNDAEWGIRLLPSSAYEQGLDEPILPAEEAAAAALAERRDLNAARLMVKDAEEAVFSLGRDAWPQLDLKASYAMTDLGVHTDGLAEDILSSRYPAWGLELAFSYPLGNRAARGELRRAELALEQSQRQLRQKEVAVWQEVRNAVRDLESRRQEIDAGRENVRLAESNLRIEEEKFKVGKTISFEVQRRNEALADARSRLLRSILDFRIGAAALRRAMGRLAAPAGGRQG